MAYPTGILKNTKTGRFHPISFRLSPTPSSKGDGMAERFKSIGHHTIGFTTLESAKEWVVSKKEFRLIEAVWEWNGDGIPAMVEWFPMSLTEAATTSKVS